MGFKSDDFSFHLISRKGKKKISLKMIVFLFCWASKAEGVKLRLVGDESTLKEVSSRS